ncbi:trypsin-like serine peptidase [Streptomyces xanthophaeus]|uniref:trypsin-like serine peptidase n=1 Tax=Streptomyces xanthophaeus TaxID=67385 RepID=UPI0004CCADAF|nr:trypsin-like serine protease [Streptomyces xanthophaeus]
MAHPADLGAPQPTGLAPQQTGMPAGPSVSLSADAALPSGAARQSGLAGSALAGATKSLKSPAPGQWPWQASGFLLYEHANGGTFRCTAAVVVHNNKSTLWTAAHCVHTGKTGNGYHKNAVFVPGFDGANTPYGVWEKAASYVPTSWIKDTDVRYSDMAAITLKPASNGVRVQDVVGAYGYEFRSNSPENDFVFALGYPANGYNRPDSDFADDMMRYCTGATIDASDFNPLDQRLQMSCDMGGGASGGPMIKNFTGNAQIVGVNSHRYTDSSGNWLDNRMFSSEHGAQAVAVYNAVR